MPIWPSAIPAMPMGLLPAGEPAPQIESLALDDGAVLARARHAMARMAAMHLCRSPRCDPARPVPAPGYVLVVDQPAGTAGTAGMAEMLAVARIENPAARLLVLPPDGGEAGSLPVPLAQGAEALDPALSPWALCEGAVAVYARDADTGLIAILAGHKPRLFGAPPWSGWGLSLDEEAPPRRRKLTRPQLVAALMIELGSWHDPVRGRPCSLEEALDQAEAALRPWREDRSGYVAVGMSRWKRRFIRNFFGNQLPVAFARSPRQAAGALARGKRALLWGDAEAAQIPDPIRIEDGYLRSEGLGADLLPPLSLAVDDLGLACDPSRESRLERLIAGGAPPAREARADRLVARMIEAGLTKYGRGQGAARSALPEGHRILVVGQVEDDAGLRLAAGAERGNAALLARVRAENRGAVILWRAHPDVAAGLRRGGGVPPADLADADVTGWAADAALAEADEVWTVSSTMGFEALLRGIPVTCLGAPFYAGWGLTRDLGPVPARRRARPTLAALAHAVLIDYPRYRDPVSLLPCPAEVIVERLAKGEMPPSPLGLAARLQRLAWPVLRHRGN